MKIRIYFRPWIVAAMLGGVTALFWMAAAAASGWLWFVVLALALLYSVLFAAGLYALARIPALERWADWDHPARLLILAPHEDDCAISAGGVALRNRRLGGATRVVYLAPDELPGMAERRAAEARAAWRDADVAADALLHLDLLPRLRQRDPAKLHAAVARLRSIIDEFEPTVVVVPMFEGGHVHHDQLVGLLDRVVTEHDRFEVLEAPEYSPYVSLHFTPHRAIALLARWLFGVVVYHGPADGMDGRRVRKYRLAPDEIAGKKRMLAAFVSQNGAWLAATRGYPDRLVPWQRRADRRQPFALRGSYLAVAWACRRFLPRRLAALLVPADDGTIGREGRVTDWREEWTHAPSDPLR
ncbi:MAG: PIG-L family deacetylase [Enhydrobacter sp.]|nr:MAG: PIG-L family deacetylase [Enhydrobacter sp.]